MSDCFYTSTRNPIARAGIIRKLMKMGYQLFPSHTVSTYFTQYPARDFPCVFTHDGKIDIGTDAKVAVDVYRATQVSPVTLKGVAIPADLIDCSKNLVFAKPAKYSMEYQKADGTVGNYTIANPIEANNTEFKTYAWGRGVRTFKHNRVLNFQKVG